MSKELTKADQAEMKHKLQDKVIDMIAKYEAKYGVNVRYNFKVDKISNNKK